MTEPQEPQQPPERYRLLIEPACRRRGRFWHREHRYPIQNAPFEFHLRFTNRDDKVFPGATVTGILVHAGQAAVFSHRVMKTFGVGPLNPGDTIDILVDRMITPLEGPIWLACRLTPSKDHCVIETYQRDQGTGDITACGEPANAWGDGWFVQRQMELQQARTNLLLILLATLALVEGVVGLGTIAQAIVRAIGSIFLWMARLLGAGN